MKQQKLQNLFFIKKTLSEVKKMAKKTKRYARKAVKARKVARKYSYATKINSAVRQPFNALQNGFTSIMSYFK